MISTVTARNESQADLDLERGLLDAPNNANHPTPAPMLGLYNKQTRRALARHAGVLTINAAVNFAIGSTTAALGVNSYNAIITDEQDKIKNNEQFILATALGYALLSILPYYMTQRGVDYEGFENPLRAQFVQTILSPTSILGMLPVNPDSADYAFIRLRVVGVISVIWGAIAPLLGGAILQNKEDNKSLASAGISGQGVLLTYAVNAIMLFTVLGLANRCIVESQQQKTHPTILG